MATVRVRPKFQITLPAALAERTKIVVGDFLEIDDASGKITITPKRIVDKKSKRAA